MRIVHLAVPLVLFALLGCAETTRWQGGDACTQISKNAEEIRDLEDRITRLQADGSSADSDL
ncbi:MAG TPA: hypothetical protein VK465_00760, partial [Fibrobacteria bacterium]|nr:hypothetical protein [Fibrobacteria bacterium]